MHYNTHTPLVTQDTFDEAARFIGMNTKSWAKNEKTRISVFNGIVFCENCGSALCSCGSVYKGEREKYWYLSCLNIPKRSAHHCENGARIRYSDLCEIVKSELNQFIDLSKEDIDEIIKTASKKSRSEVYQDSKDNLQSIEKRLKDIDRIILKLYNDNSIGLIDDEQLSKSLKSLSKESANLKDRADKIRNRNVAVNDEADGYKAFFSMIEQYNHIEELTPEIVRAFIERIEIGKKELPDGYTVATHDIPYKQNIKIVYRFIGNISEIERSFNEKKLKTAV